MTRLKKSLVIACTAMLCSWIQPSYAQTQTTETPAANADASGEGEAAQASAGSGSGDAAERARQRRRLQTTTTATLKFGDKNISMLAAVLKADAPDYASIDKLQEGEILELTRSQAIKLKTDLPLAFGDLTLKTENVAKGYAGVYGIWIKKTADGWAWVFNEKPDVWGTMHDPAADAGEIKVEHGTPEKTDEAMKFTIAQEGQGGTITISWGAHQWSAKFTIAQ